MSRQYIADGGSFAEEVISTMRTAQAFGIQSTLADVYDAFIYNASKVDNKSAMVLGGGLAIFFFILYAAYALVFSFGTTLINQGHGESISSQFQIHVLILLVNS
jgi:ATP-binding cassette subfamily B (MDR/TAP) protein 1